MADSRAKRVTAPEPADPGSNVSWVMSHYQWRGDVLLEDLTVEQRDKVISELVCNHFSIDLSGLRRWLEHRDEAKQIYDGIVVETPDGREFYVRDIPEFEAVRAEIYDKETIVRGADLAIWENTKTGALSFGWSGGEVEEGE